MLLYYMYLPFPCLFAPLAVVAWFLWGSYIWSLIFSFLCSLFVHHCMSFIRPLYYLSFERCLLIISKHLMWFTSLTVTSAGRNT
jgi:hypothetical protein